MRAYNASNGKTLSTENQFYHQIIGLEERNVSEKIISVCISIKMSHSCVLCFIKNIFNVFLKNGSSMELRCFWQPELRGIKFIFFGASGGESKKIFSSSIQDFYHKNVPVKNISLIREKLFLIKILFLFDL